MARASAAGNPTAFIHQISQESNMMHSRSFMRHAWAPLLMAMALPVAARAQERELGTWNGRVDKETQITIRGNSVSSNTISGEQLRGRFRLASPLPSEDGTVRVAVTAGRGDVSVVQQPSAQNGYTAIIRMFDRGSGADRYRVTAYFTPAYGERGERGHRGMNGRGREMGNRVGMGRNSDVGAGARTAATLRWTGDVDADAEIRWRADGVTQRNIGGSPLRAARSSQRGSGVIRGGSVTVTSRAGRGNVTVVQQPTATNDWTAVIRVHDPQPGYGHYDFDAIWQ